MKTRSNHCKMQDLSEFFMISRAYYNPYLSIAARDNDLKSPGAR